MMTRAPRFLLLPLMAAPLLFAFSGAPREEDSAECKRVIHNMFDSIRQVRTLRYFLISTERINGKTLKAHSLMKINISPMRVYMNNPVKGLEILWSSDKNKNNALVRSRSFPFMNFSLDPLGSTMRKDQHHTLYDLGVGYIGTIVASGVVKAGRDFDKHFEYQGTVTHDKQECHSILVKFPEFKFIKYTVGKNETVTSIARKYNLADYMIRARNGLMSQFGVLKEGKEIEIPSIYANKTEVYIDKKTCLPLSVKVYDDEGLYESYEMYSMKVNSRFEADEFSKTFKDYGF